MKRILIRAGIFFALGIVLMATSTSEKANVSTSAFQEVTDSVNPASRCLVENNAFQAGEEVVYKLYYNWNFVWVAAGEVVFRVNDLGDQYHYSAVGRTYKSYEWAYKVKDQYDSYVDKKTLLPKVSIRDVQEGKYTLYDKVTFDGKRNVAVSQRGKTRDDLKMAEYA